MKKSILNTLSLLFVLTAFFACEKQNMPDPVRTQHPNEQSPIVRDNAYYARLRAYKQTKHPLSFGWYGSWTAIGSSEQTRLRSAPDSMDIISIWSQWHSLTKAQMDDKAFVQKTLGTKVVICILAKDVPSEFKEADPNNPDKLIITDKTLEDYARAFGRDSMEKYQYDGIDIDYETAPDHQGDLSMYPEKVKKFCEELSKYIGPKSGTGRLFLIDGNIDASSFSDEIPGLCNYGVSQAYNSSGASDLTRRTNSAATRGWKPEQMIFTENFESKWQTGGVEFTTDKGVKFSSSLIGMADFAAQGRSAGFGAYHMEYEYGFKDMPYKYMRRAIQLANPAPAGDYSKNLVSINESDEKVFEISVDPDGVIYGTISTMVTAKLTTAMDVDVDMNLMIDNSLVAGYNDYNFTEYKTLDPALLTFSGPLHFTAGTLQCDAPVTISGSKLEELPVGEFLVPIRIDFSQAPGFSANTTKQTKYIVIKKIALAAPPTNIRPDVTSIDGTLISDMSGWGYKAEGSGITLADPSVMFDGEAAAASGWFSSDAPQCIVTIDMGKTQSIIGWRMGLAMGLPMFATLRIYNVQTSVDGTTWKSQSPDEYIAIKAPDASNFQYIGLYTPVSCRYIQMTYKNDSDSASGNTIGSSEFNVYAPKN